MRIDIKNFAKIKEASVQIDGITVIAGENNTGKSTVGKVLFSLFNATVNMEEHVNNYRYEKIRSLVSWSVDNLHNRMLGSENIWEKQRIITRKQIVRIVNEVMTLTSEEDVYAALAGWLESLKWDSLDDVTEKILRELSEQIFQTMQIEEQKIYRMLIDGYFSKVFHGQVNNIYHPGSKAEIDLCIHEQHLSLEFEEQKCRINRMEFQTNHEAVYIDSPFLLDRMNDYWYYEGNEQENLLLKKLVSDNEKERNLIDEIMVAEKLDEIFGMFDRMFEGKLVKDEDDEYRMHYHDKVLEIPNLSTGIKSFTIIRRLLERGELKEKDVLILDEPEIHLHPQWQLVYAEIIVLLQKHFDLSIIITTHSPYFLDAIGLYSGKHEIADKVHYYLTDGKEEAVLEEVSDHLDAIYEKLAAPLDELDSIRY